MKLKHWMFLAAVFSASALEVALLGQVPPSAPAETPPVIPVGAVSASPVSKPDSKAETRKKKAEKADKKAADKKAAAEKQAAAKNKKSDAKSAPAPEKHVPTLTAGPAVARKENKNVNLRGQAAINSEIVTHIRRGDLVTVIEEVTLKKPKVDEPARWAKVALPPGSVVWVNVQFIDAQSKAVIPKRLNLRSGPGENYSILGRVDKGFVVKEVETKGDWLKIEAPTNTYAFIAAHLLSTDPADLGPALAKANPPAPAVAPPPPPPPPTETASVAPSVNPVPAGPLTQPTPAARPVFRPIPAPTAVNPVPAPAPTITVVSQPIAAPAPPPPSATVTAVRAPASEPEDPAPKRIVTREGIVKGSASVQAPTYLVLRDIENNRTINYLHAPSTNLMLKSYHLQRVLVTGEEILDERWPNTPVINVETIQGVP